MTRGPACPAAGGPIRPEDRAANRNGHAVITIGGGLAFHGHNFFTDA